jgi:Domain of unknown function (DUF4397)
VIVRTWCSGFRSGQGDVFCQATGFDPGFVLLCLTQPAQRKDRIGCQGKKIGCILNNGYKNMNRDMRDNYQHFIWSSIILVFASAFGGCIKSTPATTATPVCYVSVMNEAPYSSVADVYFNGVLVSPTGGIAPGQFSSEYGSVKPGVYTIDFKVTGTDSLLYELPAAEYDTSNFYTLILYNTAPKSPAVAAASILDNFSSVTATSAYYRFFNLSPDIPSVDLYLSGVESQINRTPADNISNLMYDEFQAVNATTYSVQVKSSSTDSVLATANGTTLTEGGVYTIFLEGTSAGGVSISVLPASY